MELRRGRSVVRSVHSQHEAWGVRTRDYQDAIGSQRPDNQLAANMRMNLTRIASNKEQTTDPCFCYHAQNALQRRL
jgi:hypothetical protein